MAGWVLELRNIYPSRKKTKPAAPTAETVNGRVRLLTTTLGEIRSYGPKERAL